MFRSEAQRRWANSPAGQTALGGPAKVAEWNEATKGINLPEHVSAGAPVRPKIGPVRGRPRKHPLTAGKV